MKQSDLRKAYPVPEWIDREKMPNTAHYIAIHGLGKMLSVWDDLKGYKDREAVYEACIEKGCTWQELLGFKGYSKKELL